jgi:UDP-3-O-[3-hydroxymyristoyl] glucosamine N-acyltransferase
MLTNYDPTAELYVIGDSISSQELVHRIGQETTAPVRATTVEEFFKLPDHAQCMIGFWNIGYRINFINQAAALHRRWPTFIDPTASVPNPELVDTGSVIHPQSAVGYLARIGKFCIVGPMTNVGYNTVIGDNTIICPGTCITGSVTIGKNVNIGQSSSIKNKIAICDNVDIFMGSRVTRNITVPGSYYCNKLSKSL